MVFEVQNRRSEGKLFWHLDERYLGETTRVHQLSVAISEGKHQIKAMDESGNEVQTTFYIETKKNEQ
jgi:penicillin-binding protein 1C